jgi:hypothetical protein
VCVCGKNLCPRYLSNGFSNQAEIFSDVLVPQILALIDFKSSVEILMRSPYKPYRSFQLKKPHNNFSKIKNHLNFFQNKKPLDNFSKLKNHIIFYTFSTKEKPYLKIYLNGSFNVKLLIRQ